MSEEASPSADLGRSRVMRPWLVFVASFLVIWSAMALWALATPLFAGPDEPVQVIKAVAVDHGQIIGQLDKNSGQHEFAEVKVPGFYSVDRGEPKCFDHHSTVPASCAVLPPVTCVHPSNSTAPPCGVAFIYNARYPPMYYAIAGLVTNLAPGTYVVYVMRLFSAALAAAFMALAVMACLCWSSRRVMLIGILVAMTPMTVYLGGIVNPSALEVASALCAWTTGAILVLERGARAPRGLLVSLVISCCVMEASRPISPFWLAMIGAFLIGVAEWTLLGDLLKRRGTQVALGVIIAVGLMAVTLILREHATDVLSTSSVPYSTSEWSILAESFHHNVYYMPTMVGVFGTFDTFAPTFTYVCWYVLVVGMTLAAGALSNMRRKVFLGLLAVAIALVPVVISSSQAHRYGYTWNGRDTLPLAVGLPILAGALIGKWFEGRNATALIVKPPRRNLSTAWLVGAVAAVAGLAQFLAFGQALRRYATGTTGPALGFLSHSSWSPPGGSALLVGLEAVVLTVASVLVIRCARDKGASASFEDSRASRNHVQP